MVNPGSEAEEEAEEEEEEEAEAEANPSRNGTFAAVWYLLKNVTTINKIVIQSKIFPMLETFLYGKENMARIRIF